MSRNISAFHKKKYDVLIIGGGINGASIAHMAALAGARAALIDKGDWASGTSSKSTKLLHGGIRYLENFEFDLVAEALKERYIQWKSAPHLVKPMRFIVPVYKNQGRPLWMMKIGVWLYDVLSGRYSLGAHDHHTAEDMLRLAPALNPNGLHGGVSYFDAQMDDARICLENVLMARRHGADVLNYAEAVEFLKDNGRVSGVRARDILSGTACDIRADKVIVTAGPWTDRLRQLNHAQMRPRLRPTKGVHLVCRRPLGQDAFLLQNKNDNRIFFLIPFHGHALLGTTDTDYNGSPDDVRTDNEDIDYLLNLAAVYFPSAGFTRADIIATFAGLRPLVHERGSASKVSRKHIIERDFSGVYYVMGGKYTTYRAIAEECVAKVLPNFRRKIPKGPFMLYGSGLDQPNVKSVAVRYGVDASVVTELVSRYGSKYDDVLRLVLEDHSLKERICSCAPVIRAQVVYAMKTEMSATVEDICERRLGLNYTDCVTRQCVKTITDMMRY